MSENNDNSSDSNSRGDVVPPVSRNSNPIRSSVLRPSLFGSNLNSGSGNNPAATSPKANDTKTDDEIKVNPFLKDDKSDEASESSSDRHEAKEDEDASDGKEEKSDPLNLLAKNGLQRSNLFAAKTSMPRVGSTGFVFGQNVHERVTGENISSTGESSTSTNSSEQSKEQSDSSCLFANAIQSTVKPEAEGAEPVKQTETKSLEEVAREYEDSRAQKRKYEEVETFTGEENEINIIEINCKLFAFVNSNWEERGRGSLRLNDSKIENECSRVVFRTSGNLRLLVNTKVWHGMVAERPSQKSLRLTAMDNAGQIKIWLAMSRPDDINILHKALVERINTQKELHPNAAADNETNNSNNSESNNGSSNATHNANDDGEAAAADENCDSNSGEPSPKKVAVVDSH